MEVITMSIAIGIVVASAIITYIFEKDAPTVKKH